MSVSWAYLLEMIMLVRLEGTLTQTKRAVEKVTFSSKGPCGVNIYTSTL